MRLLDDLANVASDLGSLEELSRIPQVLERGTGADLQLHVFERSGDAREVVRFLLAQNVCGGINGSDCPVRSLLAASHPARCA